MYRILAVLIFQNLQILLMAQINCDEFHQQYDMKESKSFHPVPGYDIAPYPPGGLANFYKRIQKKTENDSVAGKVLVQFVIDTLGSVPCAWVLESDNGHLDESALRLITDAEFVPARRHGKKVISTMALPILFSKIASGKTKYKK